MKINKAMRAAADAVDKLHEARTNEREAIREAGAPSQVKHAAAPRKKPVWKDCEVCGLPYHERVCHCRRKS
jgi:hypothetical protein